MRPFVRKVSANQAFAGVQLLAKLGKRSRVRAAGPADADRYYRHLVGVERAGRRQLFVFGFCDGSVRPGPRWTEPFSIDDGGDCYFEGFYDLDENAFRDLAFHGEA